MLALGAWAFVCIGASGCGDSGSAPATDAAGDAPVSDATGADAARPEAGRDGGPACEPACPGGSSCCAGLDGAPVCVDPSSDPDHCGVCDHVCSEGRGTECRRGFCVCGASQEGCTGSMRDTCCPGAEGSEPRCRNLDTDPASCGACGAVCDLRRANGCRNGSCECGDLRRQCDGTPQATCCRDDLGVGGCHDLTREGAHCGACNFRCPFGFRCLDGVCSLDGEACPPGCAFPDACCRGQCCDATLCRDGGCIGA